MVADTTRCYGRSLVVATVSGNLANEIHVLPQCLSYIMISEERNKQLGCLDLGLGGGGGGHRN